MSKGPIVGLIEDVVDYTRDHVDRKGVHGKKKKSNIRDIRTVSDVVSDTTSAASKVKKLQAFLVNRGYNIPQDGINGKLTKAAAADFNQNAGPKRNAKAFNTKYKLTGGAVSTPKPAAPVRGEQGKAPRTSAQKPAQDPMTPLMSQFLGGAGDPAKIGAAMTNAQFGAPIANARHELGQEQAQEKHDVSTVQGWFDDLIGQNKASNQADTTALQKVLGDSSGLLGNILGSLGDESARGQVGRTALFNEGALKGIGAAEGNFNRNMDTALALTGRDAATQYENESRGKQGDIRSQLEALIAQKSNALMTNTEAARDQNLRRRGESINQFATMAMLPDQMEGAGLENIMKQLNIDLGNKELNAPAPGTFVPWAKMDPKGKQEAFGSIITTSSAFGPAGRLMSNPQKAAEALRADVNRAGYSVKKNPQIASWIRKAVNDALVRSQSAGQWKDAKPLR